MDSSAIILSKFNGKSKKQYWIEIAKEEYYEEIIHFIATGFAIEAPLLKYTGKYFKFAFELHVN